MNSVIRSIRKPHQAIATQDRLEAAESDITKALLSKNSVFDGETNHSFEDVLQSIWSVDSDAEQIDTELKNIALGDSDSLITIQNILTTAAEKYAQRIALKVVEHRLQESTADYLSSTNTHEVDQVRGCV